MWYMKVHWLHEFPEEPTTLYSEIDDDGYETRKVEIFRDDTMTYADEGRTTGTTLLGEKPIPPLEEIRCQVEFTPNRITAEEFESIWRLALAQTG
ncbi:hypothetical protein J5X84_08870 [Streptosporangiaceae bacterium NEAU-GS5]|nr:hypothetical protein [Streptosporangiaceae bacterium NEAU-GS5]